MIRPLRWYKQIDDEIPDASDDENKKGDEEEVNISGDKLLSTSKPKATKKATTTSLMRAGQSSKQPRGKVKPKR